MLAFFWGAAIGVLQFFLLRAVFRRWQGRTAAPAARLVLALAGYLVLAVGTVYLFETQLFAAGWGILAGLTFTALLWGGYRLRQSGKKRRTD